MRTVINFVLFQAVWFALVLGAARGLPWLGALAVAAALIIHFAMTPPKERRVEVLLVVAAAALGFFTDSCLGAAGAITLVPWGFPAPFSPLWMIMLWINLATTINVSLAWIRERHALAIVFGSIGGPVAYYSGAKLGAMTRLPGPGDLLLIGLAWAVVFPLLLAVNRRLRRAA